MMTMQWIVVANGSKAAFYRFQMFDDKTRLDLEAQFDHEQGRAKGIDLVTDRPGAVRGHGSNSTQYQPHLDAKRNEMDHFGQHLADALDQSRRAGKFTQMTLVASNPFLGILRAHLPEGTREAVDRVIPHDYTQLEPRELRVRLGEVFGSAQ
jgi:protein required for attachment to host cells